METPDYSGVGDTHVPHEAELDEAIDSQMRRTSDAAAIADPASPGASYVQAEAVAVRDALVAVLGVLRDAELIPSA
jgi:hypothetical protein